MDAALSNPRIAPARLFKRPYQTTGKSPSRHWLTNTIDGHARIQGFAYNRRSNRRQNAGKSRSASTTRRAVPGGFGIWNL